MILAAVAVAVSALAGRDNLSVSTQLLLQELGEQPQRALGADGQRATVQGFINLRGNNTAGLAQLGVEVHTVWDGFVTATMPVAALEAIAALPQVTLLSTETPCGWDTDSVGLCTNAAVVNAGTQVGLPADYDGSGVILGIVDNGIDYQHQAFRDSLGNSRIVCAYLPYDNSGTAAYADGVKLQGSYYEGAAVGELTTRSNADHGSHCLNIAAGTRVGAYGGVAPGADIVVADLTSRAFTDANLAASVKFIASYAKQQGKRCVISVSGGPFYGPRDGSSNACQVYSQLADEGVVIVNSVGNYGQYRGHFATSFGTDTTGVSRGGFVMGSSSANYVANGTYDCWINNNQTLGVKFLVIDPDSNTVVYETPVVEAGKRYYCGDSYKKNPNYSAELSAYYKGTLTVTKYTGINGHTNLYLQPYLNQGSEAAKVYPIAVQFYCDSAARIDVWTPTNNIVGRGAIGGYTFRQGTPDGLINDIATARGIITAGNYTIRNTYTDITGTQQKNVNVAPDRIDYTSSYGVDLNGVRHPSVSAPGSIIVSALNSRSSNAAATSSVAVAKVPNPFDDRDDYYGAMSGTSMATPCLAGIAALWLQADSTLLPARIREVMMSTAMRDQYVNTTLRFGAGKVDAMGFFELTDRTLREQLADTARTQGGMARILKGDLTVVGVAPGDSILLAKDNGGWLEPDVCDSTQVDLLQRQYDQSNWLAVVLPEPLDSAAAAAAAGCTLGNLRGYLTTAPNTTLRATVMPTLTAGGSLAAGNVYVPASLQGSQPLPYSWTTGDSLASDTTRVFLVRPKPMELAAITGAQWNQDLARFVMPSLTGLQGSFAPDCSRLDSLPALEHGRQYEMDVLLRATGDPANPWQVLLLGQPADVTPDSIAEPELAALLANGDWLPGCETAVAPLTCVAVTASTMWLKDDNGSAARDVIDPEQETDYLGNAATADQSNWLAVVLPDSTQGAAAMVGRRVAGLKGRFAQGPMPTLLATALPVAADSAAFEPNVMVPASLVGSQQVDSAAYFLVGPKPGEVVTMTQAAWNDSIGQFVMPFVADSTAWTDPAAVTLQGSFEPLYHFLDSVPAPEHGRQYAFRALVVATGDSVAPHRVFVLDSLADVTPPSRYTLRTLLADTTLVPGEVRHIAPLDLVVMGVSPDGGTLWAKDDNGWARPDVMPADSLVIDYMAQTDRLATVPADQSNWLAVTLPEPLDSAAAAAAVGHRLARLAGAFTAAPNPTLQAQSMPELADSTAVPALNRMAPASLLGSQLVADSVTCFLVRPKPGELVMMTQAAWNDSTHRMMMPFEQADSTGELTVPSGLEGSFVPDFALLADSVPQLEHGHIYEFAALVQATGSESEPWLVLALELPADVTPQPQPGWLMGDVNHDGRVDAADISLAIDLILSGTAAENVHIEQADVNGDGNVTAVDVTMIIDIVLTGE